MIITCDLRDSKVVYPLDQVVGVHRRFLRSVNLERDFLNSTALEGYIPTPSATLSLKRISEGIRDPFSRAFTLTGPYGSGKSSFALYASTILSRSGSLLRATLRSDNPEAALGLPERDESGFWPILLSGSRAPISKVLWDGIVNSLEKRGGKDSQRILKKAHEQWNFTSGDYAPSARQVINLYAETAKCIRHTDDSCLGLLVIVDELGKLLEFAALHPERGDIQVLQELAEHAVRSGKDAILFVTILHQSFEEYSQRLSSIHRIEWQKVQGRFQDIPFGDGPNETLRLISEAITVNHSVKQFECLGSSQRDHIETCRKMKLFPASMSATEYQELLSKTYPLHPLSLRVLPHIFRKFGQNERSLFSFLSSAEPFSFHEFLATNVISDESAPYLRVDHLYDYVVNTLSSTIYSHSSAKLWAETAEAIARSEERGELHSRVLKVIGLLHILGEQSKVLPSKDILCFALADKNVSKQQVEQAISDLQVATLITYRKFKGAYRPYEGSDIDLDARVREAQSHFSHGADGVAIANKFGLMNPIVARRHSYVTGTLRYFNVRFCRPDQIAHELSQPLNGADGSVLICVSDIQTARITGANDIESLSEMWDNVVIGHVKESELLHESAVSLECLRWVSENTPELRNDRVAQRELNERLFDATAFFRDQWENILRPNRTSEHRGEWYYRGRAVDVNSFRDLQELLSTVCDEAYPNTPNLQNELLNRRQLSSTAAAARRNLIDAMLSSPQVNQLGIEGFPPEVSMYRSILSVTGLHRQSENGLWAFHNPSEKSLQVLWAHLESKIFQIELNKVNLTECFELLKSRPYGLSEGVIPVLLCAFVSLHQNEVALYEDGAFITEIDTATFERLIKQPGNFYLQGCRVTGERERVLARFTAGLLRPGDQSTVVTITAAIYRLFNRLPNYSKTTRRLSSAALAIRDALKCSREPEQLLFNDLPIILGDEPFGIESLDSVNSDSFFKHWNAAMSELFCAYDELLQRIELTLCSTFGVASWQDLRERARYVLPYANEITLRSLVVRMSETVYHRIEWLEAVSATAVRKPPTSWADNDEFMFETSLLLLVEPFRNLELVAFQKSKRSEETTGYRVSVTTDTGEQNARISLISKSDEELIDLICSRLSQQFEKELSEYPNETRIAIVTKLTEQILKGNKHE